MKRIFLATGLGLGVLTFTITMASTANHATLPYSSTLSYDTLPQDTLPQDTTQPTPTPDSTTQIIK